MWPTIDDEDGVDGGIGRGNVAVVDWVEATGALAGDGRGEVGKEVYE